MWHAAVLDEHRKSAMTRRERGTVTSGKSGKKVTKPRQPSQSAF
jgi:hypothetical protein